MLDIQHLSFAVTNEAAGKEILHDITLTVDSGRFVVITGPNGGGKSTLAKMIAGIEKPTAGKILLDGTDMTDLSITDRAKLGVSYAFQQPVRFKGITVLDLLRIASGKRLSVSEACAILSEVHKVVQFVGKAYIFPILVKHINCDISGHGDSGFRVSRWFLLFCSLSSFCRTI